MWCLDYIQYNIVLKHPKPITVFKGVQFTSRSLSEWKVWKSGQWCHTENFKWLNALRSLPLILCQMGGELFDNLAQGFVVKSLVASPFGKVALINFLNLLPKFSLLPNAVMGTGNLL